MLEKAQTSNSNLDFCSDANHSDGSITHGERSHTITVDVNLSDVFGSDGAEIRQHPKYSNNLTSIGGNGNKQDGYQHLIEAINDIDDEYTDMPDIDAEIDDDAFENDSMSMDDILDKGRFVYEIGLFRHGGVNGASDRNDYILMETPPSDAVIDDEQIISPIVMSAVDSPYDDIRASDALGDSVLAYLTEEACEYDMAFHPDTATVTVQMSCVLSNELADAIDTSDGYAWYRIIPIRQNGHVSDVVILDPSGEYAYAFGASTNMKLARAYDIAIRSEANASATDDSTDELGVDK